MKGSAGEVRKEGLKYEELLKRVKSMKGEGKQWTEVAKEHAEMEKEIRAAYADRQISAAQAGRLMKMLP